MNIKKVISIILVCIWMITIFWFSNQQGEGSSSMSKQVSKVIVNLIDLGQQYAEEQKENMAIKIEPYIRKLAHFSIYALGGILLVNATRELTKKEKVQIGMSAIIGILYAVSDELHQLLISGRSGNITDVFIDTLGLLTGITVFLLINKICTKIFDKNTKVKEVE